MTQLRRLREERQKDYPALFTQEAVARRVGVTARAYQRWEAGDRTPRMRLARKLAKELGVTLDDLGIGEPQA